MPKPDPAAVPNTRELPMQHLQAEIRALPRAEGAEDAAENEFEVVISTGATVRRYDWWTGKRYDEELVMTPKAIRLDRLNAGASVLNSHRSWDLNDVIGAVVRSSANVQGGQLVGRVRMDDGPETAGVLRKLKSGLIRHVSVGYVVHRYTKIERDGQPDLWRADEWEPYEVSFVPIPADAGAGLRAEQSQRLYPCEFINPTTTRKEPPMPKENDQTKTPEAEAADLHAAESRGSQADTNAARQEAARAEKERIREIRSAAKAAGLGDDFADKLVNDDTPLAEARKHILDELARKQTAEQGHIRSQSPRVEVGEGDRDKFLRGASDWILTKAGMARALEQHTKEKVVPGEYRGLTMLDLARECLERSGVSTRGMDKMTLVGTAFTHRSAITQSTSDFAVLLENVMHKVLLTAYATTPDTWTRFCATGSVSDFRAHNRYRQGTFGVLDTVGENGEFKNKAIPDGEKETITAVTKGNIINLSRQAIINDDMGAFNSLATRFGRAAKLSIEVDVYNLLKENAGLGPIMSDTYALFSTEHANINSTGSALSAAGLDADRVVLGSQTDPSGNEILDLSPAVLVVPKGLGGQARVINESQYDPDATANKAINRPNVAARLFNDIVDTARLTGNRRYLFADPAIAPVIEVAFLDGQQEPFLESKDGWRVDGTEWKVRLDYAVGAIDWRGAVTNAGQ